MRTRRRALLLTVLLLPLGGLSPAAGAPKAPVVAPGYDLFATPDGSRVAIDAAVAGVPLLTFRGVPLGSFDFGRLGVRSVGTADTVVQRLDQATAASPRVRIELVGLLLESTNVPGWFVTLQSARSATDVPVAALGLPSTGHLDIAFDRVGKSGTLTSELLVNYDVRRGAPDGPIVFSGGTGMGFVATDIVWQRTRAISCPAAVRCDIEPICHHTPPPIEHLHCVGANPGIPLLPGVNHRLNGRDAGADFHPVGTRGSS